MKKRFSILLCLCVLITTAFVQAEAADETEVSPCSWKKAISSTSRSLQQNIRSSFNQLFSVAVKSESLANKTNQKRDSSTPSFETVIALVLFSKKSTRGEVAAQSGSDDRKKKSTSAMYPLILDQQSNNLLDSGFLKKFQAKQETVTRHQSCALSTLQLVLEVSLSDDDENKMSSALKSPILYTIVPVPAQNNNNNALFSDEESAVEENQRSPADSVNPKNDFLASSSLLLPFHYYFAEIHPFVLHNFVLGLRDLLPIIQHDRKNADSNNIHNNNNGNADGDDDDAIRQDKTEELIETVFKKVPKTSRGIGRGAILRTAESISEVVFARDYTEGAAHIAKRVIFVVNDAAVLPVLSSQRKHFVNKNDPQLQATSQEQRSRLAGMKRMSNLILSAASEGRALFIWYHFNEFSIAAEMDALVKKFGKPESIPSSITRVNGSIWLNCFKMKGDTSSSSGSSNDNNKNNNNFGTTPALFVLSDARVDDGVIKFLGNWTFPSSALGVSSYGQAASQQDISSSNLYKKNSQQQTVATAASSSAAIDTKEKLQQELQNQEDSLKIVSSLLHPQTANEAVDFVRQYANPGRALEPIFQADFRSDINPFRFIALFFVRTMGYDKNYNHKIAKRIFNEFLISQEISKGCRTGGLVPFHKKILTYDGESSNYPILVPLVITNAILQGDLASQEFAVSSIVPCFLFYDRRDRNIITDRKKFQMLQFRLANSMEDDSSSDVISEVFTNNNNNHDDEQQHEVASTSSTSSSKILAQAAIDIWKRAEKISPADSYHNNQDRDLVEEATTMVGKLMNWIEAFVPYIRQWRLWMRVGPGEMMFCIFAVFLSLIIVLVLVFLFHLIKLPENQTFKDIISDDATKREAAKQKIQTVAKMRETLKQEHDKKKK